jgi:hypothetical protein
MGQEQISSSGGIAFEYLSEKASSVQFGCAGNRLGGGEQLLAEGVSALGAA